MDTYDVVQEGGTPMQPWGIQPYKIMKECVELVYGKANENLKVGKIIKLIVEMEEDDVKLYQEENSYFIIYFEF